MLTPDTPPTRPVPAVNPRARPPEGTFDEFFRDAYKALMKQAMYAGATEDEADSAVSYTMLDVHTNWHRLDEPLAWARRAVVRFFLKDKTRSRTRERRAHRYPGTPDGRDDARLSAWEEWQWIRQLLLDVLTAEQREVMTLILDGYTPAEIGERIGVSSDAVRQRLRLARRQLAPMWTTQGAADV